VIAISGSPIKGGNTDVALEAVLEGASAIGAQVELERLYDLDMAPCDACDACQTGECVRDDDAKAVLARMSEAQAIVFGTPVYWYHVTSVMKTLLDRSYATYFSHALADSRTAAVIVEHSDGAEETASWFRRWSLDQGCTLVEAVTIDTQSRGGVVVGDQELLSHLRDLGARLASQPSESGL
jgi:multimeric flavodoxin WrbA